MKQVIIITVLIFLTISNSISLENKILFKINNEIITSLDILNELKYLQTINKEFIDIKKEKAFNIAKNSIVREKIKEIEIKRLVKGFKIDENVLNSLLLNYFKELKIKSIPELNKYFLSKNIDPNFIRKKIKLEVLWNQLIYKRYKKKCKS